MADNKELRVNEKIRIREVRLIDENGHQVGIVPTVEALDRARSLNLDLVEVAPQSRPPVCKIIDYGKYKFQMDKKMRDAKKVQKKQELTVLTMSPVINDHDLDFKLRHIERFLKNGKVKITIRFRGRQMAHVELGNKVLQKILDRLPEDSYTVDKSAVMEGKQMSMILMPKVAK